MDDPIDSTRLPSSHVLQAPGTICHRCAKLDFSSLADINRYAIFDLFWEGHFVFNLGPLSTWDVPHCSICAFFDKVKYDTRGTDEPAECEAWHLRAFSSIFVFTDCWISTAATTGPEPYVLFTVMNGPNGYSTYDHWQSKGVVLFRWHTTTSRMFSVVREEQIQKIIPYALKSIEPQKLDYKQLRRWVRNERNHFSTRCKGGQVSTTQGLKLIDCDALAVVRAEAVEYVALSYVWGERPLRSYSLHEAPQVVKDAIVVTKELKYRYLWV